MYIMNYDTSYYDTDGELLCDNYGNKNEYHSINIINDNNSNDDNDEDSDDSNDTNDTEHHNHYIQNLHGIYVNNGNKLFDIEGNVYNNKIYDDNENKVYHHENDSQIHYINRIVYYLKNPGHFCTTILECLLTCNWKL